MARKIESEFEFFFHSSLCLLWKIMDINREKLNCRDSFLYYDNDFNDNNFTY